MADAHLVRKDEATLVQTRDLAIVHRHDARLTLLPDCEDTSAKATVAEFEEGSLCNA